MCDCKNITPGNKDCYNQQIVMHPPFQSKYICIDPCIVTEIKMLWSIGIVTMGCCCGHNIKGLAQIGVDDKSINKMQELRYKRRHNECYPKLDNWFIPQS